MLDLPDWAVKHARMIITLVNFVKAYLDERARDARDTDRAFRKTPTLDDVCSHLRERYEQWQRQRISFPGTTQHHVVLEASIHRSTYYAYLALYARYSGDEGQIAGALVRSSRGVRKVTPVQEHFLTSVIMAYYAAPPGMRRARLYRLAQDVLKRTHNLWPDPAKCDQQVPEDLVEQLFDDQLPIDSVLSHPDYQSVFSEVVLPGQTFFYNYVRTMEQHQEQGEVIATARGRRDAWNQAIRVFDEFVRRAAFPGQYTFADHYLLKLFVVDDATRSKAFRLWLTILLDVFSRAPLGLYLSPFGPSIESIQGVLRHAIFEKVSHTQLGIALDWPCIGIPLFVSLDNALAHHSHSLENLARVISRGGIYNNMDLVCRRAYMAHLGMIIERFLGNLNLQLQERFPGAIQRPHDQRSVRQAAEEACFLYSDINYWLHKIVVEYLHTPHSELNNATPYEMYMLGMADRGMPKIPLLTPEVERLFWVMHPRRVQVAREGIAFSAMHYSRPDRSYPPRFEHGQPIKYSLRYEPCDISRLALFRDGDWVGDVVAKEQRQPDGSIEPISLWQHNLKKFAGRHADPGPRNELEDANALRRTKEQRQKEKMERQKLKQQEQAHKVSEAPTSNANGSVVITPETTSDYTQFAVQLFDE